MTTGEWGIFGEDACDWTAEESVEADFYSREEAETALRRYDDDSLVVHEVEIEDEDDEDCSEDEQDEDDENDEDEEMVELGGLDRAGRE